MIAGVAIGSLVLAAASSEPQNLSERFRRAYLLQRPDIFCEAFEEPEPYFHAVGEIIRWSSRADGGSETMQFVFDLLAVSNQEFENFALSPVYVDTKYVKLFRASFLDGYSTSRSPDQAVAEAVTSWLASHVDSNADPSVVGRWHRVLQALVEPQAIELLKLWVVCPSTGLLNLNDDEALQIFVAAFVAQRQARGWL